MSLSNKLYVFPFDDAARMAVLQSRVHSPWAWLLSSTMRDAGINYSASECFETFPFPRDAALASGGSLDVSGATLYAARAVFMIATDQGLTKTYNALKDPTCTDPRILDLRRLHEQMDRAVLDAYGWTDLAVPPWCPMNEHDTAQLAAFEDEVIDRLFALNAERAREEELLGLGGKKAGKTTAVDDAEGAPKKKTTRKKKAEPDEQGGLF